MRWYRDQVKPVGNRRLDGRYLLWPTEHGNDFRLIAAGRANPDNRKQYRVLMDTGEPLVFEEFDTILTRQYEPGHHPTEQDFVPALIRPDEATDAAIHSYVAAEAGFGRPTTHDSVRRELARTVAAAYRRTARVSRSERPTKG